jgi:hypothetical protein
VEEEIPKERRRLTTESTEKDKGKGKRLPAENAEYAEEREKVTTEKGRRKTTGGGA